MGTLMSVRSFAAVVLGSSLLLSGCAGSSVPSLTDSSLSPAQRGLRSDAEALSSAADELKGCQGTEAVVGAVVGGLLGAVTGALVCGDNWATCAAAGGAGGVVAGGGAGYLVGGQNCKYATEQDHLNQRIAEARQERMEYADANANARVVVAQHKSTIARLNDEYSRGQIDAERYKQQLVSLNDDIAALRKLIDSNERTVASFQATSANIEAKGISAAALSQEEVQLRAQRQALEEQLDGLLEAVASVPAAARPPVA